LGVFGEKRRSAYGTEGGVSLVTCDAGLIDWNDLTGRMMYAIQQEGKHQFLRDLARNTARGRHEAAKAGKWMAITPHGFIKVDGRLQLGDPSEIETVRRVFREYLNGHSLRSICRSLNADNIKSSRGGKWTASALASMLKNVAYAGDFKWNGNRKAKYVGIQAGELTADAKQGPTDESDWILFRDHHPAIIQRPTFEQVQQRLNERQSMTTPHRDGGGFVFTKLLRCGKCGGAMVGQNRDRRRYTCSQSNQNGTCDLNTVFQDELADIVLGRIRERFLEGDAPERLKRQLRKQSAKVHRTVDAGQLRKQLATTTAKLTKAKRRLVEVDQDMLAIVQEQIRDLTQQQQQIEAALEAARTPQKRHNADIDAKVDSAFAGLFRLPEVFERADATMQREFMRQTIDHVDVTAERDWSTKRGFYRLRSGAIFLRSDLLHKLSTPSECCGPSAG
jgi:site-specific DNA recombinase